MGRTAMEGDLLSQEVAKRPETSLMGWSEALSALRAGMVMVRGGWPAKVMGLSLDDGQFWVLTSINRSRWVPVLEDFEARDWRVVSMRW